MVSDDVSFVFDLDGTLVDSVYQHVAAWQEALHATGIELSVWRIHRRIGMSGGLFTEMLLREINREITPGLLEDLRAHHERAFVRLSKWVRPLPGAVRLIDHLTHARIPRAIATSGRMATAKYNLEVAALNPPVVRTPNGSVQDMRDYWYAGKPYWNPTQVTAPTLEVRGEWDEVLTIADSLGVFNALSNAPLKRMVVVGAGSHMMLIEKNREQLFREVQLFLDEATPLEAAR